MTSRPFIPAPGVAQIETRFLQSGQPVENVYHFHSSTAWDASSLDALANDVEAWWAANLAPLVHTGVTLTSIHARDISTQTGAEVDETYSVSGSNVGLPLPNNATLCVTMQTGLAGRSLRGRSYLVGLNANYLSSDKNQITPTAASAIVAGYDAMITGVTTNSSILSVVSFRSGNAWRTTALVTPVLRFHLADFYVDSQRRRLAGHNRHR